MPKLDVSSSAVNKNVLLTLLTATYNRAEELTNLLKSLRHDLRNMGGQVQHMISDNCSTDNTREVVEQFISENPYLPIQYCRQPENLGMDRNVFFLFEKADGDYVWFVADDDEIAPGMLARVLELLREKRYPMFVVRANNIVEWDTLPRERFSDIEVMCPADPKTAPIIYATSFLATMIFRRDILRSALSEGKKFFGTCYAPWAAGLHAMSRIDEIGFINILTVLGNKNFSGTMRFGNYSVLIKGRLLVWASLPECAIKQNLHPFMLRLSLGAWRSAASGSIDIGASFYHLLAEYAWHLNLFGPILLTALPMVLAATVLPHRLRRSVRSVLRFRKKS